MPYEYKAKVVDVIDGDTITVDIDLGFDMFLCNQKVRLLGVDSPESRTSDKIEKIFGELSKEFTKKFTDSCKGKLVILKTYIEKSEVNAPIAKEQKEKFGRILGRIIHPETKAVLNDELINEYFAVKYLGESKKEIENLHLLNRKKLIDKKMVNLTYTEAGL